MGRASLPYVSLVSIVSYVSIVAGRSWAGCAARGLPGHDETWPAWPFESCSRECSAESADANDDRRSEFAQSRVNQTFRLAILRALHALYRVAAWSIVQRVCWRASAFSARYGPRIVEVAPYSQH